MMRGRCISEEKIRIAREMRRGGDSVRAIARKLRISKSSVDRFTRDIPIQEDEALGEDTAEHEEGEVEEETSPVPEERTWTSLELTFAALYYRAQYDHACETNDRIMQKYSAERLARVRKEIHERPVRNSRY
jgi:transposase-like protein